MRKRILPVHKNQILQYLFYNAYSRCKLIVNNTGTGKLLFDRGYTTHSLPRFIGEHLDEFGLINMNGRLYDPKLSQFLSPDNFVSDATGTQAYNRYAYALNNPMVYTDPSGEFAWVPFLIFTTFSMAVSADQMAREYTRTGRDWREVALIGVGIGLAGSVVGAGMGYLGATIGIAGVIHGSLWGAASGGIAGGVTGGLTSYAITGDFWSGAKAGALSGAIVGGVMGGISGYKMAKLEGRNIWTGSYGEVSYEERFKMFVEQYKYTLTETLGNDAENAIVEITSNRTFSDPARTYQWEKAGTANIQGDDYPRWTSKILFNKHYVNRWYVNRTDPLWNKMMEGAWYHEGFHALDYYSGYDQYLWENHKNAYHLIKELRAHYYQYMMTGRGPFKTFEYFPVDLFLLFR